MFVEFPAIAVSSASKSGHTGGQINILAEVYWEPNVTNPIDVTNMTTPNILRLINSILWINHWVIFMFYLQL